MKLEEYGESLAYETAFWMQGFTNPTYPFEELGRLSLEVSEKLRALAIIVLLTQGEPDYYFHNLIRSGKARETYLTKVHQLGRFEDHDYCSGRYEAFVDSVASGDLVLARSISSLSPSTFRLHHEYEDDYAYAQILHRFVQQAPSDEEIDQLLARWKAYAEDKAGARFLVCRALNDRNQSDFDDAFATLLLERDMKIEANKARGQLEEPHIVAQRRVFVEGLALIRLAERRGLATESEYRYCPSLARTSMETPFPGE